MVDPRGGALTLGLGLLTQVAVIPHHDSWSEDKAKRTLKIAARHGDAWNAAYISPQQFKHLSTALDQHCEKEGRDPASAARASVKKQTPVEMDPVSISCTNPHKEIEVVKSLYTSLLEAKKISGEPTEGFSFPKFHRLVAQKADALKEKTGCERVVFSVALDEGHVSFKAKADSE